MFKAVTPEEGSAAKLPPKPSWQPTAGVRL